MSRADKYSTRGTGEQTAVECVGEQGPLDWSDRGSRGRSSSPALWLLDKVVQAHLVPQASRHLLPGDVRAAGPSAASQGGGSASSDLCAMTLTLNRARTQADLVPRWDFHSSP